MHYVGFLTLWLPAQAVLVLKCTQLSKKKKKKKKKKNGVR